MRSSFVAQSSQNCFLNSWRKKTASIPGSVNANQPNNNATATININAQDTLSKVSNYVFGNALACWVGNDINNNTMNSYLKKFLPTLIRYPGGSWGDIFFWDKIPTDIPSTVWDGTQNKWVTFYPQTGTNSWTTSIDNYYSMRSKIKADGLITINYGYARYGTSSDPVAKAAHLAANWVRYDDGRTKYWEIGNENAGPWEAGWKIDQSLNKDGQPEIINGQLYGKHFKVFADSMRKAAKEQDNTIYIGGQILHYDGTTSWNLTDRNWNEQFFKEVGDKADFYVMHNYFGTSTDARYLLDFGSSEITKNMNFIKQDIANKKASLKPVALTEYNMSGPELAITSFINGMQAVILFCELIKNDFGMACRWLLATGNGGMFYDGTDSTIPRWNPHPDFYYAYYIQKFIGDRFVSSSSSSSDVLSYATTFSSGEIGIVLINKGTSDQIVKLLPNKIGVGSKFYSYTLTGGSDNSPFSQNVYVNGNPPTAPAWGPLDNLENITANAYPISKELKTLLPPRSVQFVLIEKGNNFVGIDDPKDGSMQTKFALNQCYPNPFNPETVISYQLAESGHVSLKVYDMLGCEVATLVDEFKQPGFYNCKLSASKIQLSSGIYFYTLREGNFTETRKMLLMK